MTGSSNARGKRAANARERVGDGERGGGLETERDVRQSRAHSPRLSMRCSIIMAPHVRRAIFGRAFHFWRSSLARIPPERLRHRRGGHQHPREYYVQVHTRVGKPKHENLVFRVY